METVKALRVYASSAYKNDIESLTVLFIKLEEPKVKEPDDPIKGIKEWMPKVLKPYQSLMR